MAEIQKKETLTEEDKLSIKKSLSALINGPYIDDDEFEGLIQINREQVKELMNRWPNIPDNDLKSWRTIKLCILNLLDYPHGEDEKLYNYLNISEEQLEQLLNKVKIIVKQISIQNKQN